MGSGQSQSANIVYAKPIDGTAEGDHSATYRPATHMDELVSDFSEGGRNPDDQDAITPWQAFLRGCKNLNKPCLGYRPRNADGSLKSEYTWHTYKEVKEIILNLGSGLIALGVDQPIEFPDEPLAPVNRFLGIMSKNRMEWHITDFACCAYNICSVPLYDTLGDDALRYILEQTAMTAIVVAPDHVLLVLKVLKLIQEADPSKQCVKQLILMGKDETAKLQGKDKATASSLGIQLHDFDSIVTMGKEKRLEERPGGPDELFTICYTSGTTGNPKGVILPNRVWVGGVSGTIRGPFQGRAPFELNPSDVYISYLPLAHVYERIVTHCVLSQGARIGYYGGDVTKIVDDCGVLRPTVFCSVPRLYNRINDRVLAGVKDKNALSRSLFSQGLNSKTNAYRRSSSYTNGMWDGVVFSKTKSLLGGRIKVMVSGSAPIDPHVQERMNLLFCAPLVQGYGMTETCGIGFVCHPADNLTGYIGGPFACQEYRLASVPDMQYNATDTPPRGELCVRGPNVFTGYFRNPEQTQEAIDEEGWLHTGDIAEVTATGSVKIIDRKKNIFKMLQGEYVAPERIEGVYNQCPLIAQSFVFGYSTKASLVGVVVPDEGTVKKWNPNFELATCATSAELNAAILEEMGDLARLSGLKGFEKVKKIHIAVEPFSVDNGILTPTFKIRRKYAETIFKDAIDLMYKDLE